jgi:hypothetical protein
MEKRHIEGKN